MGVHARHELATGVAQADVEPARDADPGIVQQPYPRVRDAFDDPAGLVSRECVHNQHFESLVGLLQYRGDGASHGGRLISHRHEHGDQRAHLDTSKRGDRSFLV